MPVNWSAFYGIGKGDAQVWQGNKGLEYLEQQHYAQQKRRQKDADDIANEINKLNYDGAKPEDVDDLFKEIGEIKKTSALIGQASGQDQLKLKMKLDDQKKNFTFSVARSKAELKKDGDIGTMLFTKANKLKPGFKEKFFKYRSLPTSSEERAKLEQELMSTPFRPEFDAVKYFDTSTKPYVQKVSPGTPQERITPLGRQVVENTGERFDDTGYKKQVVTDFWKDEDMREAVIAEYPEGTKIGDIIEDFSTKLSQQAKKQHIEGKRVLQTVPNPTDFQIRDQRMQEEAAARARNEYNGVGTPSSFSIPYNEGKATVDFDEYVPISLSKKNFAGATPIDLKTGKPGTRLASSNDYEVVGVGNVPMIKSGSKAKKELWGTISQPNFAKNNPDAIQRTPIIHVQIPARGEMGRPKDYFIPYDRLPENVKSSKQVREALGKFKPAKTNNPASKKTTGKTSAPKINDLRKKYNY